MVLFIGFELLSIPLYVLCATQMRREHSLESGLKYLIIGSVGSATLLYGLALIYGATGSTDFAGVAAAVGEVRDDPLLLAGIALVVAGLAFKASVAPFHQWTPDVYEGAPTPITAFMAVATKAAAFGVLMRLFDVALIGASGTWGPALAALAAVTIVVGNVGAIGQSSLKRLLAYSSVAQAGYMLAGVVVSTRLGDPGDDLLPRRLPADEHGRVRGDHRARARDSAAGDDISSLYGLGAERPWLAWPMTIAMLSLAGFPATVGFFGKVYLIQAAVDNEYAWLGVVIVIGSAISLVYYLRVIAAVWMRPAADAAAAPAAACPAPGPRWPAARPRPTTERRPSRPAAPTATVGLADGHGGRRRRAVRRPVCASPRWSSSPWSARSPPSRSGSGRTRSSTSPATRARRSPRWSSGPRRLAGQAREGEVGAARPPRRRAARAPTRTSAPRSTPTGSEMPRAGANATSMRGAARDRRPGSHPPFPRARRSRDPGRVFGGAAPIGAWRLPPPPPPRRRPGLARVRRAGRRSWPPRSPWPRRRRGLAGVPARVAGACGPGCASSAATSAGPPDAAAAGLRPCTLSDGGAAAGSRSRCCRSGSAATTSGSWRSARTARSRSRRSRATTSG